MPQRVSFHRRLLFKLRQIAGKDRKIWNGLQERENSILAWNTKALNAMMAREAAARHMGPEQPVPESALPTPVLSRGCVQDDFHQDWFLYWCSQLHVPRMYHRKLWEHVYVLQTLSSLGLLAPGKNGLGFGVGLEPEPSIMAQHGVSVLATDLSAEEGEKQGWNETHQHATNLELMHYPHLVEHERYAELVRHRTVDMNDIPADLSNQFDFCWSSCALEHLGSIRKGLDFIKNSVKTLKPGGHAVHTTEFNYMRDDLTLDNWQTVLFRRRDLELVAAELAAEGHHVYPFDFDLLKAPLDFLIDVPPYAHEGGDKVADFHLRLAVAGFASTSFGIVVRKAG